MNFARVSHISKHPYTTKPELRVFDMKVESGEITVFRIKKCGQCRTRDIPKSKEYCSKECWENAESGKKPKTRK